MQATDRAVLLTALENTKCEGCGQIISDLDHALNELGRVRAENERLLVELTHRVGWEERCLRAEAEIERLRAALDTLALALTEHHHQWTDEERALYEKASR